MRFMNLYPKKDDQKPLKELNNISANHCFGCGVDNPSGLHMKFFTDEESVMSWIHVRKHMCGWSTLMHGGIISTILDEIMSWSAMYLLKKFILTKSITIDFEKPVFITDNLKATGQVGSLKGEHKAQMQGFLYNDKGELCAKSHGTFVLMDEERLGSLGMIDDKMIKEFSELIRSGF
jgi:uncharacterized protein (TIGR00369 family)